MTLPRDHPAHSHPLAVHLSTGDGTRCGNPSARRLTADPEQVTCATCLLRLAGTGNTLGLRHPDWQLTPHGTDAAARRHYRRREQLCESCKQAEARHNADYRARRAAA